MMITKLPGVCKINMGRLKLPPDLFLIKAGAKGVLLNASPLPRNAGNKRLSCWDAYWNLRNSQCRLGIGL